MHIFLTGEPIVPGTSIIGLQWGDEAKGKLVDLLAPQFEVVVRYQGGANAGHTVVDGNQVFKLHHVPSGILTPGVMAVMAPGVVVNPPVLLDEIEQLAASEIDIEDRLMLSDRTHIVMPWHLEEDRLLNQQEVGGEPIGTTLRGIGPCYRDKVGRMHAIRMGDLVSDVFGDRVREIVAAKRPLLTALGSREALDADEIIEAYSVYAAELVPFVGDTTSFLLDACDEDRPILFEGAQGSLLDVDHGTFPFVTSSNSSGVGVCAGAGVPARFLQRTIGVVKMYSTRVGGGPFPTELTNATGEHIRTRGKEFGTTTGRPRRCGWFDAVAVRYAARLSGTSSFSAMMLDVLSELKEIKICVAYDLDGRRIDRFPSQADELRRVQPVYETVPGWRTEITECRQMNELPPAAVQYLNRISELIGIPVEFVSVGPDRSQTIFCQSLAQPVATARSS